MSLFGNIKKPSENPGRKSRERERERSGMVNNSCYLPRTCNRSAEEIRFFTYCSVVSKSLNEQTPIMLHQQNALMLLIISNNKKKLVRKQIQ